MIQRPGLALTGTSTAPLNAIDGKLHTQYQNSPPRNLFIPRQQSFGHEGEPITLLCHLKSYGTKHAWTLSQYGALRLCILISWGF